MDEKKYIKQIKELSARVERLESKHSGTSCGSSYSEGDPDASIMNSVCRVPSVPDRVCGPDVSSHRLKLLRYIEKKWVNGTKLRYYFFEDGPNKGKASNVDLVRQGFEAWKELGIGLEFEEVGNISDAEIRIGFLQGDGAWSYVGRDILEYPGQFERTMNFGWDLTQDPRGGGLDTPIHEIGHSIGFPHAHQNPFAGIVWNEQAVYERFGGAPNFWSREDVDRNILRKIPRSAVEGSEWDPNSIMHYSFGGGLIIEPEEFSDGLQPEDGLSEIDIAEVRKFYPPLVSHNYTKLKPYDLQFLSIGPGEQKNFVIEPDRSDDIVFQTFGKSDSVMVLFEDVDGDLVFVDGDDDSGYSTNARIETRLVKGRKYVLRVRLYLNWASGDTALMMW